MEGKGKTIPETEWYFCEKNKGATMVPYTKESRKYDDLPVAFSVCGEADGEQIVELNEIIESKSPRKGASLQTTAFVQALDEKADFKGKQPARPQPDITGLFPPDWKIKEIDQEEITPTQEDIVVAMAR